MKIHPYKTRIFDAYQGIEFLGAYIKPFRTYISSSSLRRIKKKLIDCKIQDKKHLQSSINSFLGVFSHYESYCLRKVLFRNNEKLKNVGNFDGDCLRFRASPFTAYLEPSSLRDFFWGFEEIRKWKPFISIRADLCRLVDFF